MPARVASLALLASTLWLGLESIAAAQTTSTSSPALRSPFEFGAYVEVYWQWNANAPDNGLTNLRGFDNRHNSLTLSNVALEVQWDWQDLVGRLALQVGHTPATYYAAEPTSIGSDGANTSNAELFRYIQEAYVGYRFGGEEGLMVTAGVFLSPIGPEAVPIHQNWNWSRSNLFFGLPFYHTGARAAYWVSERLELTAAVYNGWNSIVDGNAQKSVSVQLRLAEANQVEVSALYFGGVERERGAKEGSAWRHLFDVHATWHASASFALRMHLDAGFEPNEIGLSHWFAAAIYARLQVLPVLALAARGDYFFEGVPARAEASASPIFWPVPWVSSATLTLDFRPIERLSFQLELRHDHAGGNAYFSGAAMVDGAGSLGSPNDASQDTFTLGLTGWL